MTAHVPPRIDPGSHASAALLRRIVGVQIIVDQSGSVVVAYNHPDAQIRLIPRAVSWHDRVNGTNTAEDLPYHRYGALGEETACGIKFQQNGSMGSSVREFRFDSKMCPDCFTKRELELGRAADSVREPGVTSGNTERTALHEVDAQRARMFNRKKEPK